MTKRWTRPEVPGEAQLHPGAFVSGVSYPTSKDPTHALAFAEVHEQRADWAEVVASNGVVLYRVWRVSPTSFAWQTSAMAAPAFHPYATRD